MFAWYLFLGLDSREICQINTSTSQTLMNLPCLQYTNGIHVYTCNKIL